MKAFKNILFTVLLLLIVALVAAMVFLRKKSSVQMINTNSYGLKVEKRSIMQNLKGSIDYMVEMGDSENGSLLCAIYDFEVKASADITPDDAVLASRDTLFFPVPDVMVDQHDDGNAMILQEKGKFEWNDDIRPVKEALEMMAKDYGRRTLSEKSGEELKKYFESVDKQHKYIFDSGLERGAAIIYSEKFPLYIDCFPDILKHNYSYESDDSSYVRSGIYFKEYPSGERLFSIDYCYRTNKTMDELKRIYSSGHYLSIVDPFSPKDNALFYNGDYLYFVQNKMVFEVYLTDKDYLPDVLYLLSCANVSDITYPVEEYLHWAGLYDDCIDKINKKDYRGAKSILTEMEGISGHNPGQGESLMRAFVDVMTGVRNFAKTGYTNYDPLLSVYSDLATENGILLRYNKDRRENALSFLAGMGDDESHYTRRCLCRFLLNNAKCSSEEKKQYEQEIVESGDVIDYSIICDADNIQFHQYLTNILYRSAEKWSNGTYNASTLESAFPSERLYANGNVMMVYDCTGDGADDESKYGKTSQAIYDALLKKGLNVPAKEPLFILLVQTKREGIGRGMDRDAVVFSRDSLYHIPNYDGITGSMSKTMAYKDLNVGKGVVLMNKNKKFDIASGSLPIEMISTMSDVFKQDDLELIKKEMLNYISKCLWTFVYWVEEPVSISF